MIFRPKELTKIPEELTRLPGELTKLPRQGLRQLSRAAIRARRIALRVPFPRKVGAPPGTLEAPPGAVSTEVRVIRFDEAELEELEGLEHAAPVEGKITWVDAVGLGSVDVVRTIGERFGLHPLALEDALSPHQRSKVEDYPSTLFIVVRAARAKNGSLDIEQISTFVGEGFVITIQERAGDAYEPVRDRLRRSLGRVRKRNATYLAYALLDATVDAMFPLLEIYERRLDELDDLVFRSPNPRLAEAIHDVGRELMAIRRSVVPMRESLARVVRHEHPLIDDDVRIYLRDCQDHLLQMVDTLNDQRDLTRSLMEGHLSSLGHRSNEVMKVLTMIATIFIPLSFIAGLYGMNFDPEASPYNMPELHWAFGYPMALGVMFVVVLAMLVYFRRKGWL